MMVNRDYRNDFMVFLGRERGGVRHHGIQRQSGARKGDPVPDEGDLGQDPGAGIVEKQALYDLKM